MLAVALLVLGGCDEYSYAIYGSVSVGYGTGYVYLSNSGWSTETTATSLTVSAVVTVEGDAYVENGQWVVIDAPFGTSPILSNPYSPTTLVTFPTTGVYQMEYRVYWYLDGYHYSSSAPVQFVVYPVAPG